MTKLLMYEVDVKNVTEEEEGRGGEGRRRGPARVWGSDEQQFYLKCAAAISALNQYFQYLKMWRKQLLPDVTK